MKVAEKWDGRIPGFGTGAGTWKERARRAEAEREAARLLGHMNMLELDAQMPRTRAGARRDDPEHLVAHHRAVPPARAIAPGGRRAAMIAFGAAITRPEPYERYAEPGIRRRGGAGLARLRVRRGRPDRADLQPDPRRGGRARRPRGARARPPAPEIADPDFCATVRRALRDPDVGVVGCVGAAGVRSIAWWEGVVSAGRMVHRYGEHGGGDLPAYSWAEAAPAPGEVDAVDGALLVLSPWAVRNVRFDESLRPTTGSTSTTAGRSARPGARSSPPTCAPSTTTRSR